MAKLQPPSKKGVNMETENLKPAAATATLPEPAMPEDVAQALFLISSILSLNDDPAIQPGQLTGMSQALAHAKKAWSEMKKD